MNVTGRSKFFEAAAKERTNQVIATTYLTRPQLERLQRAQALNAVPLLGTSSLKPVLRGRDGRSFGLSDFVSYGVIGVDVRYHFQRAMVVIDACVVLRWFVEQEGHEQAVGWLRRFIADPELLVAPDLLRFEVHGALARLTPKRDRRWAQKSFERFDRVGIRTLSTDAKLLDRALALSAELRIAAYDAIYVAHAEALGVPWLTANQRVLRRLGRMRVQTHRS